LTVRRGWCIEIHRISWIFDQVPVIRQDNLKSGKKKAGQQKEKALFDDDPAVSLQRNEPYSVNMSNCAGSRVCFNLTSQVPYEN